MKIIIVIQKIMPIINNNNKKFKNISFLLLLIKLVDS